jgi:parallel beta-helix repeat protein/predicted outer membrane repeat protein
MKTRRLILVLVALALSNIGRADLLDVPLTPQEQNNWCWAACTKAVLSYYQKPVEERQLAHRACMLNGWSDACDCWTDPGGSTCNHTNGICASLYGPGAIDGLLANWGLSSTCGLGTCSFDTLVARIDTQHRPLIARLQKGGTIGHFVVIRGATESGDTSYVHYMNPWPVNEGAYSFSPYDAFVNDGTWSWTHTLKVSRRYPPTIYAVQAGGVYPTIQSAIDAASDMDQVWIYDGTYTGTGNQDITFGGKEITVRSRSGRPEDVVIDPQGSSRAFLFQSGENPGSIVEALTVHGAQAPGYGSAVNCSTASPTFLNCRFELNMSPSRGGAVYAVYSCLSLLQCTFAANEAYTYGGAVAVGRHSSPALIGCSFNENYSRADGGGVWCDNSLLQGAIRTPVIMDCSFASNTAGSKGGGLCCHRYLTPHVYGCTLVGNSAPDGGGIAFYSQTDGWIRRCTLSGNSASGSGGGIYLADTTRPSIDHTIISFSALGDGLHCQNTTAPSLSCVDIHGNAGGDWQGQPFQNQLGQNGNVSVDPAFCGSQNPTSPYALSIASPCAARNNAECGQIGSLGVGCGMVPVPGLGYGVLIAHHPPGAVYSAGDAPCDQYALEYSIGGCGEQVNRIDGGRSATLWYVVAAWETDKQWCGAQFGLGPFPPNAFSFEGWGGCSPGGTVEVPTPGWPGPNQGVILEPPPGASWAGNFVPIYWFAGYAYQPGMIPLSPHPETGIGGWTDCAIPPETWQASCFGSMGVMTEGGYCCPGEGPAPARACCGSDGTCALLTEPQCADLGGAWHEDWHACSPNPCPPRVAVCCAMGQCALVSEAECDEFGGVWHAEWASCQPDPCVPSIDWADHAIGDCVLSVTDRGILGFMDGTQQEGSGFVYPKSGENQLYIGSLWVGLEPTYIANRDYDLDPAREWRVSAAPDGHVWLDEDGHSQLDIHASYTDSAAAQPRRLFVEQESWSYSGDAIDDFVILRYRVFNRGATALANTYVGLFLDADLDSVGDNEGRVDAGRNLVYLTDRDTSDLCVGVRLLEETPGDPPVSNLTLIANRTYVYPNQYVPDAHKYGFLTAGAPEYVLTQTPAPDDYSLLAAAGPFSIAAQDDVLCAFAVVGGTSHARLLEHADAAASLYGEGPQNAPWDLSLSPGVTRLLPGAPNPFRDRLWIGFDIARAGRAELALYDASGRRLRTLLNGWVAPMRRALVWDGRDDQGRPLPSGAYFLRLNAPGREETQRLIRIR